VQRLLKTLKTRRKNGTSEKNSEKTGLCHSNSELGTNEEVEVETETVLILPAFSHLVHAVKLIKKRILQLCILNALNCAEPLRE